MSAGVLLALQFWSGHVESTPLASWISQSVGGAFAGDRIASWVALVPLMVVFLSARSVLEREAPRHARLFAMGFSLALVAVLTVLALHVSQELVAVLEPLKRVLLLGAGFVLTPVALGCFVSEVVSATRRGLAGD